MKNPRLIKGKIGKKTCNILIGSNLLEKAGSLIAKELPKARAAILTDENVAEKHLGTLLESIQKAGIKTTTTILPSGEKTKNYTILGQIIETLLDHQYERSDVVIALGGGVVTDIAGFCAGVTRRGMQLIHIPTSLLAQVDSSIGGKTGINTKHGKNMIGVFHQPRLVIIDTKTLKTLPERQYRAGYAEIVKYSLINQPNFFSWLEKNWMHIRQDQKAQNKAIEICCKAKLQIIGSDECDEGSRHYLNFGHTFAHSLEAAFNYDDDRLIHGEAVSIGMVLACKFSEYMNITSSETTKRVEKHLETTGLLYCLYQIPGTIPTAQTILNHMMHDKKASDNKLTFILIEEIGKTLLKKNIPPEKVFSFLKSLCL